MFGDYEGLAGYAAPADTPGWYDYSPTPYRQGANELWYWTMDDRDTEWLGRHPWAAFVSGRGTPGYAEARLAADFVTTQAQGAAARDDVMTADTRQSDNPNPFNPIVSATCLIQLAMGGLTPRHGFPLHCRLRYFDAALRRPGLPAGVAALVTRLSADGATVELVNTDQVAEKRLHLQGGAYGEHTFLSAKLAGGEEQPVGGPVFRVRLGPGSCATLELSMARYSNPPSFALPWDR